MVCNLGFWKFEMRIGELSKRSGLSRDTIRFYEREGLIQSMPALEATNSYRHYPEEILDRLDVIGQAQDAGFSISDLKYLTAFWDGTGQDFDGEGFLKVKAQEVKTTIERAQGFLNLLEVTIESLERGPS
ncbi:MerR family transcriptional regulator [Maritalea sp.]|uniref:MerR family transcriptional regulator n=1 Tax=Maritalea sp. TaxID=2003361 RepID=UPI003EF98EC2